jgi:undecaprenyl-diphosphatase
MMDLHAWEQRVMLALRDPQDLADPVGPWWFERFAVDMTALGGHSVLGLLCVIVTAYLLLRRRSATAWLLLGSAAGAMLASALLKELVGRARPDLVEHLVEVTSPSFPSGHAMLSASIYLTLGMLLARQVAEPAVARFFIGVAAGIIVLIGLSRVYLGVHWPSDVLGGWLLGTMWAWGTWVLAKRMGSRSAPH